MPRDILQVGRDTCNSSTAARVYCVGTGTSTAAPAPASRRAAAPPTGDTALPGHGPEGGADGHPYDSLKALKQRKMRVVRTVKTSTILNVIYNLLSAASRVRDEPLRRFHSHGEWPF